MAVNIVRLDNCRSTNAELGAMPDAPDGTVVVTDCQTAGRGQRGASWESLPGANLTFSQLFRPEGIHAARQFELSMLISLAIVDTLNRLFLAHGSAKTAKIKWPNDIYVDDFKLAGILIENKLAGPYIERSIAGIGLNVNQTHFVSDAPNPVSIVQIIGAPLELEPLLADLCTRLSDYVAAYDGDSAALKSRYMSNLYRNDGREHPFAHPDGTRFRASIVDVAPTGHLTLSNSRTYAFKEVAIVIE